MKTLPHFGTPAAIKVFDAVLEPRLARRRKDGHDAQTEATADDAANASGVLMRTLKTSVVDSPGGSTAAVGLPVAIRTGLVLLG